jgi:hypothetical protein
MKVVAVLSIRTSSKLVTVTPVLMFTLSPPVMDRVSVVVAAVRACRR